MVPSTEEKKIVGLLPMDLAETNNERTGFKWYPVLQKVFAILLIILFAVGFYVLILRLLQKDDNIHNTEIIVLSGFHETENMTILQDEMEIIFQLKNISFNSIKTNKRQKRELISVYKSKEARNKTHYHFKFKDNEIQRLRKMISEHDVLCIEESHKDACEELVMKIKMLTENNVSNPKDYTNNDLNSIKVKETNYKRKEDLIATDIKKRETYQNYERPTVGKDVPSFGIPKQIPHSHTPMYGRETPNPQLTDTCLLARLMRQSFPDLQGVYNNPQFDFQSSPYASRHVSSSYFSHNMENHEVDAHKHNPHPQDIEIAMHFIAPKHNISSKDASNSSEKSAVECPEGMMSCNDGTACVNESEWCDGKVDCGDVSDEARCTCRSRVDKIRVCDGYFDCPFGEDEMGCFDCDENTFSCGETNSNTQSMCYSVEQRCNNIAECPNHRDELDCSMLAPSLHKKPLFAVSNTEGFLHRNYKGNWYAVCNNPYMWAHDACRRETGLIIRPPFIQVLPIDPLLKVSYLNTGAGGLIHTSSECFNSSAVYVTCPDLLCGTRMLTPSQLIKENVEMESRLFGRNKRFLYRGRPYPATFYGERAKRYATNRNVKPNMIYEYLRKGRINETRSKRAEGRVVGGRPSQPTAWPWMVALYRNGMFHCGGVIIHQNWVMSAAHCVHKFWEHYYEVQAGMLRRFSFSPQEQNHRVSHIIVNQKYNQEDMKNDLSLLRVKPGIQFSRWARPICLPSPEVAGRDWLSGPPAETICTAVGWGATIERGPDPDHMREVEVPIWDHCKHEEDQAGKEICAGLMEGGKDACQGDSGGPLLCRNPMNGQQWYVAGIVSHGDGCARKDEPGVYTRVSLYVSWIKYHISSRTLPIIQPKQECPGFRCESGISKCLPKKRMCDKIIDCLDGEDEINCDIDISLEGNEKSSISNAFTEENNKKSNDNKLKEADNILLSENKSQIVKTTEETPLTTFPNEVFSDSNKNHNKYVIQIENTSTTTEDEEDFLIFNKRPTTDINTLKDDMHHASTIEFSNLDYSQEIGKGDDIFEYVTSDPRNEALEEQTIKINTSTHELQSLSATLEIKPNENIQKEKDESNLFITTTFLPPLFVSNFATTDSHSITTMSHISHDLAYEKESEKDNTHTSNPKAALATDDSNRNKTAKESREVLVDLLKNSNASKDDIKSLPTENKFIGDQEMSETNLIEHSSHSEKPLHSDIDNELDDTMFLELPPAKIRKKHLNPMEFQCRRIYQIVSYAARCDHKPDCEDGTDELDCTCLDYLTTYDSKLICDGNFDCADGQDEIDCYICEKDQFLCKRSQICLDSKYVCDGTPQCPLGEDELDCFTLSNGKHILYDLNGRPEINLEGYITKKSHNNWQIVCEENMPIQVQEETATRICRYLGFSSANRYKIKYIHIKNSLVRSVEGNNKNKRNIDVEIPVHFTFKTKEEGSNNSLRSMFIENPEVIKESCVPNVTKTCMTLYVYCDHSLYTHFDVNQVMRTSKDKEDVSNYMWPWIAKLYVDGKYKCIGVLIDLSWVLVSQFCLQSFVLIQHYITVVLGSHSTLRSTVGPYEQVYQVDAKKDLYRSKVILLHLKQPAVYSAMVKPMVVITSYSEETKNTLCTAVGQTDDNKTFNVFLKETDDCDLHSRCFIRQTNETACQRNVNQDMDTLWSGIISCHTTQGWYPAASFVQRKNNCGDKIIATDIGNLKHEIKYYEERPILDSDDDNFLDECEGTRCKRGTCVKLGNVCDGLTDCEDGSDESRESCEKKRNICKHDPLHRGCECPVGHLKCSNGKCIPKELFMDGRDDCGDGTDEPGRTKCSDYLSRVMPSRLCDGILHCHDRSDEDPMYCKCFAKKAYKCTGSSSSEDYCVASDMVCDGVRDCPNGEDEKTCIGLSAPQGTPYGIGEVLIRSHGIWHSKCYTTRNHTKSDLEAICRELGFLSGHAKQLPTLATSHPHNHVVVDKFSDVTLNNNTSIKLRNSNAHIARGAVEVIENCYPVFIECL